MKNIKFISWNLVKINKLKINYQWYNKVNFFSHCVLTYKNGFKSMWITFKLLIKINS